MTLEQVFLVSQTVAALALVGSLINDIGSLGPGRTRFVRCAVGPMILP